MAIEKDFQKEIIGQTVTCQNAYWKIIRIHEYSKEEGVHFDVQCYPSKDDADKNINPAEGYGFHFKYNPDNTDNALTECYKQLKTLPMFKEAKDV